ncbi:ArsR/SmtB family transcription factor [Flagellimonas marinaquae]|uniref:ArsR/SmtB family transcription factor n=1 Tax=Flagellimonas marinaquae TaxID=254955 RepID=UPI002074D8A5|nr:metalloregulator ArsR/SmtB family transcription factor [Allomuricauda aquimarina]USD24627.1 metalloregulator ArsR/SmtB family transcription factor [Allomuricauda aquimarina]
MDIQNSCIRAEADHVQILRCKEDLSGVTTSIEAISKVMALAGNEVRFKILYLLQRETELCPCDFADILVMSVPAISQHLRKMKDANVISARRAGQTILYRISKENQAFLAAILSNVVSERKIA